jgi:tetratricopeptide (TPR) repeat protein
LTQKDPQNTDLWYSLSGAQAAQGKDKEQKASLERVVAIQGTHAPALAALGSIAFRGKITKLAESYYDKSLSSEPDNPEALIGKARTRRANDDPKGAEAALNRAIKAYPDWALPRAERARIYREEGFLKEALADLNAAKALAGDDYWIAIDMGNVLMDMGKKKEALTEYDRAIALDPDIFLAYVYSAGLRDEMEDYPAAERDYRSLAKLKPEYYFAFEGLGVLLMRTGRWGEAKDAFLAAYARAPRNAGYALLASLNWMRAGKPADARPFLAKALTAIPRDTTEWFLLRLYHDQTGDTDITLRIDKDTNADNRSRMIFYLAQYYDIRGNTALANKYFLQVQDMNRQNILEWRLNQWVLQARITRG